MGGIGTYLNLQGNGSVQQTYTASESIPAQFSGSSPAIGEVQGQINVPSQGLATPQTGLEFCCYEGNLDIVGIGDADGGFVFFSPINVAGTNYSSMTLSATDPLTGSVLGSETVSLSGLSPTTPTTVPTLTISGTGGPTVTLQASCAI